MGKQSGLGARVFVAGVALSGDVRSLQIASPRTVEDLTGVDVDAMERGYLTRDGSMALNVFFNPTGAHPVFSALPTADQLLTYAHRAAVGSPAASLVGKQIGYDWTRDTNGAISGIAVQAQGNRYGLEWGRQLTPGGVQLASGEPAGAGLDFGAAVGTTAFGLQAYLHLLALDGDDVTLSVQHSDDDGAADPWADVPGGIFAQALSAPGSQRLQTDRVEPVKRWLRLAAAGTFNTVDVAAVVVKNGSEVLFG